MKLSVDVLGEKNAIHSHRSYIGQREVVVNEVFHFLQRLGHAMDLTAPIYTSV